MTDQKNSNQVMRELTWLDAKESDPSSLNVWELRGRNINEELHTPSLGQPPLGPICVQSTVQTLDKKSLPTTPNQSKYSCIS